jgi:putative ABC transport system ATP-binding protein
MSDRPAIVVQGVTKAFDDGRLPVLNGVDLEVEAGAFVAISGPSGCGKSTLLHLIAALDHPDAGHIHVFDADLDRIADAARYRRSTVGIIFQFHHLLPALTALENVEVPMFGTGRNGRARARRARELLERVGLGERCDHLPAQLSGGERQRVAIARALANDPRLLLADEPTGSLDSAAGANVLELIAELRATRDLTVVLVTHDARVAAAAERRVEMLDGRIGTMDAGDLLPDHVLARPAVARDGA